MFKKLFCRNIAAKEIHTEPSRESRLIGQFLGCECRHIPAGTDPDEVRKLFEEAQSQCAGENIFPVLVSVSDNLIETLLDNAGVAFPEGDALSDEDRKTIAAFRDDLIEKCTDSDADDFFRAGEEWVAGMLRDERFRRNVWENRKILFDDVIPVYGSFVDVQFTKYRVTALSREVLLAKIPAAAPWQLAAWLPMGGWNECPAPKEMLSVAKRWYEKYRAVICCVTSDELEFCVSAPPTDRDESYALAKEFFSFCEDRLVQYGERNNLATLAAGLTHSPYWYFWWD